MVLGFSASLRSDGSPSPRAATIAFQVGKGHAGLGASRQDAVQTDGKPGDQIEMIGPRALDQIAEIAASAVDVADSQPGQPASEHLGIVVMSQEPVGIHPRAFPTTSRRTRE